MRENESWNRRTIKRKEKKVVMGERRGTSSGRFSDAVRGEKRAGRGEEKSVTERENQKGKKRIPIKKASVLRDYFLGAGGTNERED